MIYLDNNATTPVDPEVYDAVFSSLKRDYGNPSSSHLAGRKAREAVENGRRDVADFLGCSADEVYFTSGGTESNNLALIGSALFHKKGHIITSSIEHPSVSNTCRHLESLGFEVTYAAVDGDGVVDVEEIRRSLREDTFLISVMHANNETGVLQPIEEIGAVAKAHGTAFHTDAAQSVGKIQFSLTGSPIDFMTLAAHKFYGPKGVGALYVRTGARVLPLFFGAGHEKGLRPGTENVAGITGLGKACGIGKRDIKLRVAHTLRLRDLLLDNLRSLIPGITLNGHKTRRLPNTANVTISGISSYELVEKIKDRVAISTGSACHSGEQVPSRVLKNMGLPDEAALSSVRLSVGKDNTEEEIVNAAGIIAAAADELRRKAS
jgi:cysteine desulfurase